MITRNQIQLQHLMRDPEYCKEHGITKSYAQSLGLKDFTNCIDEGGVAVMEKPVTETKTEAEVVVVEKDLCPHCGKKSRKDYKSDNGFAMHRHHCRKKKE